MAGDQRHFQRRQRTTTHLIRCDCHFCGIEGLSQPKYQLGMESVLLRFPETHALVSRSLVAKP